MKKYDKNFYGNCDHPSTMENGTATFLWAIIMVVSLLFKGGWVMCIFETMMWMWFVNRHNK